MLHTKVKVIATGLILSVGLIGCEGLLSSLTGDLLEEYLDDLEAGKATVEVTSIDSTFDRLDVWLEKIDPEELDLELDDLEDDAAVKEAAEEEIEAKKDDLPESIPEEFAAGYGEDNVGSSVDKEVSPDATHDGGTPGKITSADPAEIEGYVYVVYALLRDDSDSTNAKIGVSYVVVDGDETDPDTVSLDATDPDVFQDFNP